VTNALHRGISWLAFGQGAVRGAQMIAALVLAHLMPAQEWNTLALALSVYLVGVTIGSLNLEHSVLTFLPLFEESKYGMFLVQTRRFLVTAGFGVGAIVLGAQRATDFVGGWTQAWLLATAILLEIPAVVGASVFVARGQHRAAGLWDAASAMTFLFAVFTPAFLVGSTTSVLWGLAGYGAARFVGFAVVVQRVKTGSPTERIDNLLRRQIVFCAPLGISLALGTLTRAVDKWIVAWNVPDAIGAYAIAAQEVPLLAVLPYAGGAAVAAGLVRHLDRGEHGSALELWRGQAATLCLPVVLISVGTALLAPELFALLLPAPERGAAMSFGVFSLIGVHRVTEYGVVLRAANRNVHIVESAAVVLIGCIVFGFVGARLGGIVGVSVGTALAFGVGWLAILRRVAAVFGVGIRAVFPWAMWFRALNAALTAFVGGLVAGELVEGDLARLVVKLFAFAVIARMFMNTKVTRSPRLVAA